MKDLFRSFFILILLLVFLPSCSTVLPKMEAEKFYRLDMGIEYLGKESTGYLLVPQKPSYEFNIIAPGKIDILSMRSCSREVIIENDSWIRRKSKKMAYNPTTLERGNICDLEFWSYEKSTKARHAIGYVIMQDQDGLGLPAEITCEDGTREYKGASFCQAHNGYIQSIKFMTDVLVSPDERCFPAISGGLTLSNEKTAMVGFDFEMRPVRGFCTYVFQEIDSPGRTHRLVMYGYDNVLMRED